MSGQEIRWPSRWLMTDERLGDGLWTALDTLPPGDGGVVLRHDHLSHHDRAELAWRLRAETKERRLKLAVARDWELAASVQADLVHQTVSPLGLPSTFSVHDEMEAERARVWGAVVAFVSPVFETESHPDDTPLGADAARALAKQIKCHAVALGGMNEERFKALGKPFHGWAGISAFLK